MKPSFFELEQFYTTQTEKFRVLVVAVPKYLGLGYQVADFISDSQTSWHQFKWGDLIIPPYES